MKILVTETTGFSYYIYYYIYYGKIFATMLCRFIKKSGFPASWIQGCWFLLLVGWYVSIF
jgi:hypothetical protein